MEWKVEREIGKKNERKKKVECESEVINRAKM